MSYPGERALACVVLDGCPTCLLILALPWGFVMAMTDLQYLCLLGAAALHVDRLPCRLQYYASVHDCPNKAIINTPMSEFFYKRAEDYEASDDMDKVGLWLHVASSPQIMAVVVAVRDWHKQAHSAASLMFCMLWRSTPLASRLEPHRRSL